MDRVCPLLGLQGDRRSVIAGIDSGHRCHAEDPPTPLDRQQQARICLTDAHDRCDRYLAFVARHRGVHPGRPGLAAGLRSTRMVLAPEPAWRGIAGQARRARTGPLALIGAGATVLGIGGVALATGILDGRLDPGVALETGAYATVGVSATPSPSPTARATPSPTPIPSLSAAPTPVLTPVPTVPPTPAPTVAPPPQTQQTYTVVEGDTLAAIAQRFGTTVARLQAANGIEDPNEIFIGQVLVIA